jgi:hypothetical protein
LSRRPTGSENFESRKAKSQAFVLEKKMTNANVLGYLRQRDQGSWLVVGKGPMESSNVGIGGWKLYMGALLRIDKNIGRHGSFWR